MSARGEENLRYWLASAYVAGTSETGFAAWFTLHRAQILAAAAEATQGEPRTAPKPIKTGWDGMSEQEVIATVREIRGEP